MKDIINNNGLIIYIYYFAFIQIIDHNLVIDYYLALSEGDPMSCRFVLSICCINSVWMVHKQNQVPKLHNMPVTV